MYGCDGQLGHFLLKSGQNFPDVDRPMKNRLKIDNFQKMPRPPRIFDFGAPRALTA
jgi:hypothetical protein